MRNDADEIKVGEQVLALGYPIAEDVEDLTGVVAPLSFGRHSFCNTRRFETKNKYDSNNCLHH